MQALKLTVTEIMMNDIKFNQALYRNAFFLMTLTISRLFVSCCLVVRNNVYMYPLITSS